MGADGLLRAICEDPGDMGLREIYADWLEEHGETERSSFIHVQVELADLPRCDISEYDAIFVQHLKDYCRCCDLRRRERELLHAHEGDWLEWLKTAWGAEWVPSRDLEYTFRRGFVETITCNCADWLQHGPQIVLAQPVLEVRLTDRSSRLHLDMPSYALQPLAWARQRAGLPRLEDKR